MFVPVCKIYAPIPELVFTLMTRWIQHTDLFQNEIRPLVAWDPSIYLHRYGLMYDIEHITQVFEVG